MAFIKTDSINQSVENVNVKKYNYENRISSINYVRIQVAILSSSYEILNTKDTSYQ